MAMNRELRDYLRSLGISEHEISGYNLSAYNFDKQALKQAIQQAVRNAIESHLSPEDDGETYDEPIVAEVRYLAEFVGEDLDKLRQEARCGNVAREKRAAAKIQALYREADHFLSE